MRFRSRRHAAGRRRGWVADYVGPGLATAAAVVESLGAAELVVGVASMLRNSQQLRDLTYDSAHSAGYRGPFLPPTLPRGHYFRQVAGTVTALAGVGEASGVSGVPDSHELLGLYALAMTGSLAARGVTRLRRHRSTRPTVEPAQVYFPPPGGWPSGEGPGTPGWSPPRQQGPGERPGPRSST